MLVSFGCIIVLCNVLVIEGVLCWCKGFGLGWVIVEYEMFLCVINEWFGCELCKGKVGGCIYEIFCLVGCFLCVVVDDKVLGENIIIFDCDVL